MGLLPTSKIMKDCQRGCGPPESEIRDFSSGFRNLSAVDVSKSQARLSGFEDPAVSKAAT
jgi:hypothetical protein